MLPTRCAIGIESTLSLSEYDKLSRLSAPLPGSTSSLVPPVLLRVLINLEESLASASTSAGGVGGKKSKMNATSAKALTALKQKVKKAARENESILAEFKTVGYGSPIEQ